MWLSCYLDNDIAHVMNASPKIVEAQSSLYYLRMMSAPSVWEKKDRQEILVIKTVRAASRYTVRSRRLSQRTQGAMVFGATSGRPQSHSRRYEPNKLRG